VRRAALILLVLILTPSMATASWYRCAYDGTVRSACCCPAKHGPREKGPAHAPSLRAACCCTVTHITPRDPTSGASPPASIGVPALAVAVTVDAPRPSPASVASVAIDRPRAQGDPPVTLFARRCSLLL